MQEVKLGDRVKILGSGNEVTNPVRGKVVGKCEILNGATEYRVKYFDTNNALHHAWLTIEEIEIIS